MSRQELIQATKAGIVAYHEKDRDVARECHSPDIV